MVRFFMVTVLAVVVTSSYGAGWAAAADACSGNTPYTATFTNYCKEPIWLGRSASASNNTSVVPQGGNWALSSRCTEDKDCPSGMCEQSSGRCTCLSSTDCPGGATCNKDNKCSNSISVCISKNWDSGVFWPRTGCTVNDAKHLSCETGQCTATGETNGLLDCGSYSPKPPVTQFELTTKGGDANYDVSLVGGYNVETRATPIGGNFARAGITAVKDANKVACYAAGCNADLLPTCPSNLQVENSKSTVIGCLDPCTRCQRADPPADLKCTDLLENAAVTVASPVVDVKGGSVTLTPMQSIPKGGKAVLVIKPDAGFKITSVTGCGGTLSGTNYTTGALNASCTVTVTFTNPPPKFKSASPKEVKVTFPFTFPTYRDMYCAKNMQPGTYYPQASPNQGTPLAFSQADCFPGQQSAPDQLHDLSFVIPTWPKGYTPPAGQGVCLYINKPQSDIPHFNDYGWTQKGVNKNCGGTPAKNYKDALPDGTPCGGYLTVANATYPNGLGYTCQTVTFKAADTTTKTAHLCLPPLASGLGTAIPPNNPHAPKIGPLYQGVGGLFNPAWLAAGLQAGGETTPYYETFKTACAPAYSWQYDDISGGFGCDASAAKGKSLPPLSGFEVVFCGSQKPKPGIVYGLQQEP